MNHAEFNITHAIVWVIVFLLIGFSIASLTGFSRVTSKNKSNKNNKNNIKWYNDLKINAKPPSWVFGIVWSILYILLAIVGYMLWINRNNSSGTQSISNKNLFILFVVGMILNWIWTPLFFGIRLPGAALLDMFLLIMLTAPILTVSFSNSNAFITITMILYLLWLCFAFYLNYQIWRKTFSPM